MDIPRDDAAILRNRPLLLRFFFLSLFAFLFSFEPANPFLVSYLVEEKDLTEKQVYQDIFPLWTYTYFISLIFLGLFSEYIGYKWTIFFGVVCNITTLIILTQTKHLFLLQFEQVTDGIGAGSFIIFSSFLYQAVSIPESTNEQKPLLHSTSTNNVDVSKQYYQKVTSIVKASYLIGTVSSSLLGQLLEKHVSLNLLFYITLGATTISAFIILFFPTTTNKPSANKSINEQPSSTQTNHNLFRNTKNLFVSIFHAYSNLDVVKWSLWGAVWSCMYHFVVTYWQSLAEEIDAKKSLQWNGYVIAVAYSCAALSALIPAKIEFLQFHHKSSIKESTTSADSNHNHKKSTFISIIENTFLIITPFLSGSLLIGMTFVRILEVYLFLVLFHCLYEFMTAIASTQVAKSMPNTKFGMIFSINMTVAIGLQTLIQFIVGERVLGLDMKQQFFFYGSCLLVLSILSFIATIGSLVVSCFNK